MGASNNKSPSQLRRDNQIKEEKIIANIRGATSYKISSSASSEDKLYDIIDRSYVLDDYARNRAKQTVEWLSEEEQDELLLNVMLDGADAYFSRKAFAQGGYNMFFGRDDVRLFPDLVQPGEGIARQTYEQTKYVPNPEKPITYTNTSANVPIPEFGGKNSGSLMGGYTEELQEYLSQLELPDTPEKQTDPYGGSQYHWDYKNAANDGGLGLEEARKEPLPTRDEWSDEHKAAYDRYRAEYPMPDYHDLWAEETRLLHEVAAGEKELRILMAQGNRNFPPYYIQGEIDKQREALNKSKQELRGVQQLLDGKEYDPYLYKVQPLYAEYKEAKNMVSKLETQLESDFSGSYSNAELNDKYKKWSGEAKRFEKEIAAIPIILTEETLSIPEAAKHADALSMRMPITKDDHRIIREAKADVGEAIEHYRENGQTAEMLRAYDVWFALGAKQEISAAITGAFNGATYNLPKRLDAGYAVDNFEGANVASPQLEYMRSMYSAEMTNPGAYEAGEQVVNAVSTAISVKGLLDKFPRLFTAVFKTASENAISKKVSEENNKKSETKYKKIK